MIWYLKTIFFFCSLFSLLFFCFVRIAICSILNSFVHILIIFSRRKLFCQRRETLEKVILNSEANPDIIHHLKNNFFWRATNYFVVFLMFQEYFWSTIFEWFPKWLGFSVAVFTCKIIHLSLIDTHFMILSDEGWRF